ncbi:MFS transporter [Fervidobacterium islandicum]|uniref:MFS transporter n=1 Tax=Fervidobacterium islandicum TaxID=2423 RepID=A0AAI8CMZ0_FERIS|nr:MFS transporter [Fervidobacterium islandicum]AMW33328.1 MFS transporter [Fervidobacterium islandicum]
MVEKLAHGSSRKLLSVDEIVETYVNSKTRKLLLFITSLMWSFDAAGVLALSFTLPAISKEWALTVQQSANILSATFIGMLIGALSVGFVADFLGRKISNIVYFLFTVVFSLFLGFTNSAATFLFLRLLAGIGYGGLMPSVNAYLAEFLGKGLRGAYLVLLEASWAIGSILIGLVSVTTVQISWRITYWAFAVGLVLLPILLKLPESPKFAFKKHGKDGLEKVLKAKIHYDVAPIPESKVAVIELLKSPYLSRTIMIWASWFVVSFVYYTLFSWAPKIFAQQGLNATKSLWFTFFMMVAQLPGYLSAAYFIEKLGRKKSLAMYFIGMSVSAILWAFVGNTVQLIIVALLLSFFTLGVWGLVYAYTPELYPTTMRGTGNGMAGVVARIAGILAPQFAGYMFSMNKSLLEIFSWLAGLSILAAVIVLLLAIETKNVEIG